MNSDIDSRFEVDISNPGDRRLPFRKLVYIYQKAANLLV